METIGAVCDCIVLVTKYRTCNDCDVIKWFDCESYRHLSEI